MKLLRLDKKIPVKTEMDLIRQFILWFSVMKDRAILPPREEEYLVCCVELSRMGSNLRSKKSREYIIAKMGINTKHVGTYRTKLLKKGWLVYETPKTLVLRPDFQNFFVDVRRNRMILNLEVLLNPVMNAATKNEVALG